MPADSPLIPRDSNSNPLFTSGQKFRLLFVTSTWRDASSTDIAVYNRFVQDLAAAQSALAGMKGQFRALISTASVDARDNTGTTGAGVPIYWLRGAKVADNYADLYDGSWDSGAAKDEREITLSGPIVWNGSDADGTRHATHYAGATSVSTGPASSTSPLSAATSDTNTALRRLYALSPVITVE